MNKFIGIGNLTKDPELTTTASGVNVARFSIAISRRFENADGERETDFLNCVAWRNLAETIHKYCHKGDKIAVVGSIQVRNYETQDGEKRYVTEIVVDEIEFLTKKNDKETEKTEEKPKKIEMQEIDDSSLPF